MYWITNDFSIMDNIVAAKARGLDVQIIFDETSHGRDKLVAKLLSNNITPVIFPSRSAKSTGIMHNKFLVIDNAHVVTGSANFTKAVLDPKSKRFNFENVTVFSSNDIAQKYLNYFAEIKQHSFQLYINIVAKNDHASLSEWLTELTPALYRDNRPFQEMLEARLVAEAFKPLEQSRIEEFFGFNHDYGYALA
jgi:phosphatidylserine/phosphatidylglycerophosphate/cardiolipin synthase-like enzyme